MSKIKLYLNENIHIRVAKPLIRRGFDVVTTDESGRKGQNDFQQLEFATKQKRAVVSFNIKDFAVLHKEFKEAGKEHYGIIVSKQIPIGELLKRLLNLCNSFVVEDMKNRLEYLSEWK